MQIAHAMDPGMLVAWHFGNPQASLGYTNVNEGFYFESISPQGGTVIPGRGCGIEAKDWNEFSPEDIVTVAEVGVIPTVRNVEEACQQAIAKLPQARDVAASPTLGEPRPFSEVRTFKKRGDKPRNLSRVRGAIGVYRGDNVAGRRFKATSERVALASSCLPHNMHVRADLASDFNRIVHGKAIDDNDFMGILGDSFKNMRDVPLFIERRNNHGYLRR
jgi:hypothetical protein